MSPQPINRGPGRGKGGIGGLSSHKPHNLLSVNFAIPIAWLHLIFSIKYLCVAFHCFSTFEPKHFGDICGRKNRRNFGFLSPDLKMPDFLHPDKKLLNENWHRDRVCGLKGSVTSKFFDQKLFRETRFTGGPNFLGPVKCEMK